ncbi:MAG: DUF1800 family protein [Ghiorsea sp.]|nr:DUF1800 family protein [Ghiorsea sp.]
MQNGFICWVDQQLNMPSAYDSTTDTLKTHLERTIEISQLYAPTLFPDSVQNYVQNLSAAPYNIAASRDVKNLQMAVWWENALDGPDQLRQRVAYALSQLEVVSDGESPLDRRGEALAYYYDILARNALGNYKTLLLEVAKSPAMGIFLSHQGNKKTNLVANTRPDENFAREIMQLFTIGLYKLSPDGTRQLDVNGNPLPSYTQFDIEENARILTGWDLVGNRRYGLVLNTDGNYITPMEFTPAEHEFGTKTVLGQPISDDGLGGDLTELVNLLFNHPNTAPFVSRHLIVRLVTSNPSPAYVGRVSAVFMNNSAGVRGDLKAVVRAVLMDSEARGNSYIANPNFGKADEPLLAFTRTLKTFRVKTLDGWQSKNATVMNGVYWYKNPQAHLGQGPLRSSTVFNFYDAEFIPSDPHFITNKLQAPELQIQTISPLVNYNNRLVKLFDRFEKNAILETNTSVAAHAAGVLTYENKFLIDFDDELQVFEMALDGDTNGDFVNIAVTTVDANGETPRQRAIGALLTHLNDRMFGGVMPSSYYTTLANYLDTISMRSFQNRTTKKWARLIIKDAVQLLVSSSEYKILK